MDKNWSRQPKSLSKRTGGKGGRAGPVARLQILLKVWREHLFNDRVDDLRVFGDARAHVWAGGEEVDQVEHGGEVVLRRRGVVQQRVVAGQIGDEC